MISITLPSIHPPSLERALANIRETTQGAVEVIVVSPYPPSVNRLCGCQVVWIEEKESEGANAAHELAFIRATGDFVLAWVDDHAFVKAWDAEVIANFCDREHKIPYGPMCLGLRQIAPAHVGTIFGCYYPYFPMMRRKYVEKVGGWLSGKYRVGFADCDLALRICNIGGSCEWSYKPLVMVLPDDERKVRAGPDWIGEAHTTEADMRLFLERWANRYGAGYDTSSLRGFNVDVDVPPGAQTIWKGQPQ